MSMSADHRSTNVPMYEALTPCKRCGVLRKQNPSNSTEVCLSCSHVARTKVNYRDIELTGGFWAPDGRGIQRWVTTT
jgi:hypothetical protein